MKEKKKEKKEGRRDEGKNKEERNEGCEVIILLKTLNNFVIMIWTIGTWMCNLALINSATVQPTF